MTEEEEIKAVTANGQSKLRLVYQEIVKVSEGIEMQLELHIADRPSKPPTSSIPSFGVAGGLDKLEHEEDEG